MLVTASCSGDPWEASDLEIVAGIYNTSDDTESSQQTIGIEKFVIHPQYDPNTYNNDVALLELSEDVRYTPQVSPVCFPTGDIPANTMCVTTGWGKTESA